MLRYTMKLHDDKTIEFEFLAEDDVRRQLDGACWTKTGSRPGDILEYQPDSPGESHEGEGAGQDNQDNRDEGGN